MNTVLITGGTGMIGTALSRYLLDEGYHVIILSRNPRETAKEHGLSTNRNLFRSSGSLFYAKWDPSRMTVDAAAIREADYIVHLAGAGVAEKRWTESRKKEILQSRTVSSSLLVKILSENSNKVKAVVSASAIGWYGPDKERPFIESDPASDDFLGRTCLEWEKSIDPVSALGKRLVKLRLGIALARQGGALREFRKPLYAGLATVLGDGRQTVSWVHIEDICRAFTHAIEKGGMEGVYNLVAPMPVTNRELILSLARHSNGRLFIPIRVPSSILHLALGEMSVEVLKSANVDSSKLRQAGFEFRFTDIDTAIGDLVG
jgi:uncharacterized protein (TIGR01777 family)